MADCSQEQTIFCLNVISNSKGLLFLIYAPYQYFTHYGSAYVQLKSIQILTICLISKGLLFLYTPCRAFAHDVTAAMLVFQFKRILIRLFCLEHQPSLLLSWFLGNECKCSAECPPKNYWNNVLLKFECLRTLLNSQVHKFKAWHTGWVKKTDSFAANLNNISVRFFLLTLYRVSQKTKLLK
jgi:hypothetical protein